MREILFRAKEKESGEWVHGYYSEHTICGDETYISPVIEKVPEGIYDYQSWVVDPNTVGQYTGMKDKNEVKIFEGDVVAMHYFFEFGDPDTLAVLEDEAEIIGIVGIDEYGVYTEKNNEKHYWLHYLDEPSEELEVLGNIHDNPELLEVGE